MIATFDRSQAQSSDIVSFFFITEQIVEYTAGQFIELMLPHANPDSKGSKRWFTLSSSPTEPGIAISVKCSDSSSSFKQALQNLKHGDEIHISDPLGDFVLPLDSNLSLVWIAGGIGITPFRSMAKWLADSGEVRNISFFQSVNKPDEAIFKDVLAAAGINRQHVTDTSSLLTEHMQAATIIAATDDPNEAYYYVAGPEAMVSSLATDLLAAGIPRSQIISDAFLGSR